MNVTRNQRTLAATAAVDGVGYWSGKDVRVEFCPAPADSGVVFVREDLPGKPRIAAQVANRIDSPLRTTLRSGGAEVEMIEHMMAALAGLRIDNCEILVNQAEMPGCDGSALPFVEALSKAGAVEQNARRSRLVIDRVVRIGSESSWIEARPGIAGKTVVRYELDYGSGSPIGRQSLEILLSPKFFHKSLAPSRTFILEREAEELRARGLAPRTTFDDLLVFGSQGPIQNTLRFPDECVRHKIVDLVGDLALAGCDFCGRFTAYRSGHRLNGELVRAILAGQQAGSQDLKRCA